MRMRFDRSSGKRKAMWLASLLVVLGIAVLAAGVALGDHKGDGGSGVLGTSTTSGGSSQNVVPLAVPASPQITSSPSSPTSSTSASFMYTDTSAISRFECSLDSSSYSTCGTSKPSTKSYSGLSAGSHTFRVRAVLTGAGGGTSSATAFTWTIDRTAPHVVSINRADPSPTNAASVHWTVTFSEPVTGVAANFSNFSLSVAGIPGSPAITGLSGSGATYTVTASTGSGTPTGGTEQLRLTSAGAIKDLAGNGLTGVPDNGQTYTVDKTAPPVPNIIVHPSNPDNSTLAFFAFVDVDPNVTYLCSFDNGAFAPCFQLLFWGGLSQGSHSFRVEARDAAGNISGIASWGWLVDTVAPTVQFDQKPSNPSSDTSPVFKFSGTDPGGSGINHFLCRLDGAASYTVCTSPKTLSSLSLASHTFRVESVDNAGNTSSPAVYTWTIQVNNAGQPYTITATINGSLHPGAPALPILLAFSSQNSGNGGSGVNGTQVSLLTVAISSITDPGNHEISELNGGNGTCATSNYALVQFSGTYPFYVPFGSSDLNSLGYTDNTKWPSIQMLDNGKQDACKGATVHLTFQGNS